jgi:hypothetical protein
MAYEDLEAARAQYEAIRALIIHHAGGWHDEVVLRKLDFACAMAAVAVPDRQCKVHVGAIEDYCRQLYSPTAHLRWARARTSGADYLRLQILRELDAFHARLGEIEALRDGGAQRGAADRDRPGK